MLSAPKIPSTEVEAEEDEVEEEDVEGLELQRIGPITIMNNSIIQNTLITLKVKGGEVRDGPISPIFSVTTAISMPTMNLNT